MVSQVGVCLAHYLLFVYIMVVVFFSFSVFFFFFFSFSFPQQSSLEIKMRWTSGVCSRHWPPDLGCESGT